MFPPQVKNREQGREDEDDEEGEEGEAERARTGSENPLEEEGSTTPSAATREEDEGSS